MYEIYFGLVALLSACEFQSVDCVPTFTKTPSSNDKVYVDEGANSFTLSWDYNADGEPVTWVDLMYGDEVLIARKTVNKELEISPASGFSGRITFSGKATFKLWNIVQSDGGKFECKVYFRSVVSPWIKSRVELVVVGRPNITLQTTEPVILTEGDTRTLVCGVSDTLTPLITWYRDNTTVQTDPNNSNYTITSANKNHTGTYKCEAVVTAPGLSTYKTYYTVDVIVRFKPQHKVDSLISNQTVVKGSDVEFYCRTEALPVATQYRWFKDGSQIYNSEHYAIEKVNDGESRLTVKQANKSSAGQYSCDGENDIATGRRKSAFLIVKYAPQQVTVTPDPALVSVTQNITLICQADGLPEPSFSWKFNGNILNEAVENTFTLTNVALKDTGNYTCVAANDVGVKESTRVVNLEYQPTCTTFTTGTPGNSVVQGTTVTLTCRANGYPPPTYTIKRRNTTVNSVGGKFLIPIVQISEENENYSCEPRNKVGSGPIKELKITIKAPPTLSSQLPTTTQTKTENETVSYSCVAEAKPAAAILWQLNGQNLTEIPPYNYSVSVAPISQSKLLKTLSYLTITKVTWRQHGNFSCLAYNDAGKKIQTTDLEVRFRPVVQFSADHPKNLTLEEGSTATFTCKTIGNPPTHTHKWQFNGKDISGESCSGCSTTTYTKTSVSLSDAGWYSCTGTNILGEGPPARAQLSIKMSSVPPTTGFVSSPVMHRRQMDVHKGGLSIGAVSGIVIAIIVVVILACLAVYFLCIKTQGSYRINRFREHRRNEPDSTQFAVPRNSEARKLPGPISAV